MKKEVKILSLLLVFCLLFCFCGCEDTYTSSENSDISDITDSSSVVISSEQTTTESEDTLSEITSSEESKPVESVPVSSVPVVSTVPSSIITTPSQPEPLPTPPVIEIAPEFIVNDPDNTRGLSEKSMGYGHGQQTAKNNQAQFNSMSGVDALAIDMKTGKNVVYLTFDCGYEYNNLTASILDTLKQKNVKAVFFCTLSYLKQNPHLVWRMINEGHIVGNHSATHPVFPTISRTKMAKEVYEAHKYLQTNFGYTSKYFRFPTGAYSHSSLELVTSIGYKSIFWSFAYKDWETANQPEYNYALDKIKGAFYPGSVLLLHAVSATNTALLPQIIDYGISQGYTFATLDEYYTN